MRLFDIRNIDQNIINLKRELFPDVFIFISTPLIISDIIIKRV